MENPDLPVFAGQYRFEPSGDDWDQDRSSLTHLVYDLKKKRLGVLKRAEMASEQATAKLKNEVRALIALMGLAVPRVYETGRTIHDSKNYFYIVTEYIDGMRLRGDLDSLTASERAQILTQFFGLLKQAHRRGIVNGRLDIKGLFWHKDKRELIVVDWGKARLGVDPKQRAEFTDDLACSAEIIFSLVSAQEHPAGAGSIALPDDAGLIPGLAPLPVEFRNICQWALPTTGEKAAAPHTASELYLASSRWLAAVNSSKPYKPPRLMPGRNWLLGILAFVVILAMLMAGRSLISGLLSTPPETTLATPVPTLMELPLTNSSYPSVSTRTSPRATPTIFSTQTPGSTSAVPLSAIAQFSPFLAFDGQLLPVGLRNCWQNETTPALELKGQEAFYRSYTDGKEDWWRFSIDGNHVTDQVVQTDFQPCFGDQTVGAMALNAWVTRLEPESGDMPGMEFGFFLEGEQGQRREYTLWIDETELMHVRIRENDQVVSDNRVQITTLHHGEGPRGPYDQFFIQIFLELDDEGFDVLYLFEGPGKALRAQDLGPGQMIRMDDAMLPALGDVEKIGLMGRGGPTNVLLWPLAFFTK